MKLKEKEVDLALEGLAEDIDWELFIEGKGVCDFCGNIFNEEELIYTDSLEQICPYCLEECCLYEYT